MKGELGGLGYDWRGFGSVRAGRLGCGVPGELAQSLALSETRGESIGSGHSSSRQRRR